MGWIQEGDDEQYRYTVDEVERLIGLHETWGKRAARHRTVLDILSRARDPGHQLFARLDFQKPRSTDDPHKGWMALRGPLDPESDAACILWDFLKALSRLGSEKPRRDGQPAVRPGKAPLSSTKDPAEWGAAVRLRGVVALSFCGFTREEISALTGISERHVSQLLAGRPVRDGEGKEVRDPGGNTIYRGGAAWRLTRIMNGDAL